MKRSDELKQQRSDKLDEIQAILDAAKAEENRSLTDDERTKIEAFKTEARNLSNDIDTQKLLEQEQEERAKSESNKREKQPKKSPEEKASEQFSFIRAIKRTMSGKPLDGIEAEMFQEAHNEARQSGLSLSGNIAVPGFMIKRDLTAGTNTQGGHTIQTDVGDLIPILEPKLQVEALGATMLTGLVGNLDLPRGNADASATWEGENDANAETSPTFDKISLSPNRLGAFTDISKQLMVQSSIQVENYVRRRLEFAIAKAVDLAAINGSGTAPEPEGILNVTGIGDVAGGTNGLAPTFDHLVDLESEIAVDNADMGRLAYLTTPGIRGKLKKTKIDTGSGLFVWGQDASSLNGYNAVVSTQVPSTLTKGSSTDCHAIIFGNWEELIIAQWAGLDLVVDPYTGAKSALVTLVANSWWDVAVRHAESFAAMKDARIV